MKIQHFKSQLAVTVSRASHTLTLVRGSVHCSANSLFFFLLLLLLLLPTISNNCNVVAVDMHRNDSSYSGGCREIGLFCASRLNAAYMKKKKKKKTKWKSWYSRACIAQLCAAEKGGVGTHLIEVSLSIWNTCFKVLYGGRCAGHYAASQQEDDEETTKNGKSNNDKHGFSSFFLSHRSDLFPNMLANGDTSMVMLQWSHTNWLRESKSG